MWNNTLSDKTTPMVRVRYPHRSHLWLAQVGGLFTLNKNRPRSDYSFLSVLVRPDAPSRCTLPITALRVMPPSCAPARAGSADPPRCYFQHRKPYTELPRGVYHLEHCGHAT